MKTLTRITFALLTAMFVFCSCSRSGEDGIDGKDGVNATVSTFELKSADWKWNANYMFASAGGVYTSYFTRYYDKELPALTEEFVSGGGIVLVYMQNAQANNPFTYVPVPFVIPDFNAKYEHHYRYEMQKGKVRLHFFFSKIKADAVLPTLQTYDIPTAKFKVAVLTGEMGADLKVSNIDINNMNAVNKFIESYNK